MLGDFQIYPWRDRENVVLRINKGMRFHGEEPYLSTLLFGQIPMLAYYLATVPPLADSNGVQPVVFRLSCRLHGSRWVDGESTAGDGMRGATRA